MVCYFWKRIRNMAQCDERTDEKGTNSIFVMSQDKIRAIPKDRIVTYTIIVVDYQS